MIRVAVAILALAACGKKPDDKPAAPASEGGKEVVQVPGAKSGGTPTATADKGFTVASCAEDDPKKHIQADEGTLAIGKAVGKSGAEATAQISVTPASGYHVSTDFPTELAIEAPAGVKLAKTDLQKSDADKLAEQGLVLSVKATADKAGAYEIKGCFKFGVCDKESCHPKRQPITIQVAAN
jgi:hypothetical protein